MAERFGRYEVRGELGRGGMASVYRAWDPRFHREVAVKVLSSNLSADRSFRVRFEREARAIAALEHHAIVPVYDFGEEGGDLYLVMRLLTGGSLADRIAKGPVRLVDLVPVVQRVAEALDYAHSHGLIHRDVKPGNIMFDAAGNAYLSDFGIARMADQTSSLTGTGLVGSPAYMSPEQAEGKTVTAASDIYSLGATVYEALSGRRPFVAENALSILLQQIREDPRPLTSIIPEVSENASKAVAWAMAKDSATRPRSAAHFARALSMFPRSPSMAAVGLPPALSRAAETKGPGQATRFVEPKLANGTADPSSTRYGLPLVGLPHAPARLAWVLLPAPALGLLGTVTVRGDVFTYENGSASDAIRTLFILSSLTFVVGLFSALNGLLPLARAPGQRRRAVGAQMLGSTGLWSVALAGYHGAVVTMSVLLRFEFDRPITTVALETLIVLTSAAAAGCLWAGLISTISGKWIGSIGLATLVAGSQLFVAGSRVYSSDPPGLTNFEWLSSTHWAFRGLITAVGLNADGCSVGDLAHCELPGFGSFAVNAREANLALNSIAGSLPLFGSPIWICWVAMLSLPALFLVGLLIVIDRPRRGSF